MLYIIDFWKVRYYYEFIIKNSLKSHQRLNNENKAESFQSCCICFVTGIASLCVYPWSEVLVQDFPQYFRILAAMRALQPWCVLWGFGSKCSNPAIWMCGFSLFSVGVELCMDTPSVQRCSAQLYGNLQCSVWGILWSVTAGKQSVCWQKQIQADCAKVCQECHSAGMHVVQGNEVCESLF